MDEEWDQFTLGLGTLVQAAALVEYTLHGLTANLTGEELPYGEKWASDPATSHIAACESKLQGSEPTVPQTARDSLLADLAACRKALKRRNLFIHSCWQFDEETYSWFGLKASREKSEQGFPQIEQATTADLHELVEEFDRLNQKLLSWDTEYFGQAGDPELGEPERVSVKRLR